MRSTEFWLPPRASAANDSRLEELRYEYYARLDRDRARLATLSAELAHAETDAMPVYEDIRSLARRMGGAAAVFEAIEIGNAAVALEQATLAAINARADNADTSVWTALEGLVDLLLKAGWTQSQIAHARPLPGSTPDNSS
jgi:HPt (histidine-containing phosphotransfer) domain-containing protein